MGSAPSKPAQAPSKAPTASVYSTAHDEKRSYEHDESLASGLSRLQLLTPLSGDGSVSSSNISSWEDELSSDPTSQLARTVLNHADLRTSLESRNAHVADLHVFNNELAFSTGPVTNQKSSGRCWIFATTNVMRYDIMKKLHLKDFQLSQSYTFFWDKLNKSNYYLELSIQLADSPIDDRTVNHLAKDLISDGGQWDMVVNLLENYGVVPQAIYPESYHSSASSRLNSLLKTKLREHALILRKLSYSLRSQSPRLSEETVLSTLRSKKEALLKEVYAIMTATLGVPPRPDEKFVYEYYDEKGKVGRWEGTPLEFYKTFSSKEYPPSQSFSLINDPRNEYSKLYTVDKLGNVWNGRPILYVNTEVENMKAAVVKMIKAGQPVFFGCDVGQFSVTNAGIMDTAIYKYESAFNIELGLTKTERLQTNESAMTHAMVISGVHLDTDGKPVRYKVENSWGETAGDKGYFVMTDAWFDQFVYQVVVPKALASKELVQVLEAGNPSVLPPWDPMGALA